MPSRKAVNPPAITLSKPTHCRPTKFGVVLICSPLWLSFLILLSGLMPLLGSGVHAFAYRDVGRARLAAGDVAAAVDAFEAALRFDPEDEQARLGLDAARCRDLVERGALEEARAPCARAASAGLVPELALEHLASQLR